MLPFVDGHCYETGVVKSKMLRNSYSNKWSLASRGKLLRENGPNGSSSERWGFPLLASLRPLRPCFELYGTVICPL